MTHRQVGGLAVLAGVAALGVAYFAQDFLHLVPCPLCLWERWPYRVVIGLGVLAVLVRPATGRVVVGLIFDLNAPLPLVPAKPCDDPTYLIPVVPVSMAMMDFLYALAFGLGVLPYVWRKPRRFK